MNGFNAEEYIKVLWARAQGETSYAARLLGSICHIRPRNRVGGLGGETNKSQWRGHMGVCGLRLLTPILRVEEEVCGWQVNFHETGSEAIAWRSPKEGHH